MGIATRRSWLVMVALGSLVAAPGCQNQDKKMEEKQRKRDVEKKGFEVAKEAKQKAAAPKLDRAALDAPWAGPEYLEVGNGTRCPEGLWALFPEAPGEGPEREANEAKRAELLQKVKGATFSALLPLGGVVAVGKYNAKKKTLPVRIEGVIACFDGLGLLSFALTHPTKPQRPKPQDTELSPQAVWRARDLIIPLPFESAAAAKEFTSGPGTGLEARVVFTAGEVEVDKKLIKPPKPVEGQPALSDTPVDWGAGRLVHVELVGVRIGVDHEKVEVATKLYE
jgi:hypothetical protein